MRLVAPRPLWEMFQFKLVISKAGTPLSDSFEITARCGLADTKVIVRDSHMMVRHHDTAPSSRRGYILNTVKGLGLQLARPVLAIAMSGNADGHFRRTTLRRPARQDRVRPMNSNGCESRGRHAETQNFGASDRISSQSAVARYDRSVGT